MSGQIPKPTTSIPRPNFTSKLPAKTLLPNKNLLASTASASVAANRPTIKAVAKIEPKTRPAPLKPLNRNVTATSAITRAPKRAGAPVPTTQAKIAKKPPVQISSGKSIRKSIGRKSLGVGAAKKPAPYDYKARFKLLSDKHIKTVEDLNIYKSRCVEYEQENLELKQATEELHTKNVQLETQNQKHLDEKNILQKENRVLKTDFDIIKKKLEESLIKNEEILNKNVVLCTENQKYLDQINKIQAENSVLKSNLESINNKFEESLKKIEDLETENSNLRTEFQQKLFEFDNHRKYLHNCIQDLKGNIRVFCRIRPSLESEMLRPTFDINYLDEKSIEIKSSNQKQLHFGFDKVFGTMSEQRIVFDDLSQLVQSVLDGYNVCVFAYGQTGSGKTYTMEGGNTEESRGMIPRAIELLYDSFDKAKELDWEYSISASFVEIYNEHINNLLKRKQEKVEIKSFEQIAEKIESKNQLIQYLLTAQKNRTTAATESNDKSSRSHAMTSLIVEGINSKRGEKTNCFLNLVDLAGSEKMQTKGTDRVAETKNINTSLLHLTRVIMSLKQNDKHIPYRSSKLTMLLKDSLGGNSKTLMIVNIAPFQDCLDESINSLRFATSVNQCKVNNVKRNKIQLDNNAIMPSK